MTNLARIKSPMKSGDIAGRLMEHVVFLAGKESGAKTDEMPAQHE